MNINELIKNFEDPNKFYDKHKIKINIGDIICFSYSKSELRTGIVSRFTKSTVFCYPLDFNQKNIYEYKCIDPTNTALIINKLYSKEELNNYKKELGIKINNTKIFKIARKQFFTLLGFKDKKTKTIGMYLLSIENVPKLTKNIFINQINKVQEKFNNFDIYPILKNKEFSLKTWEKTAFSNIKFGSYYSDFGYNKVEFKNCLIDIQYPNDEQNDFENLILKVNQLNDKCKFQRDMYHYLDENNNVYIPTEKNVLNNKHKFYDDKEYKIFSIIEQRFEFWQPSYFLDFSDPKKFFLLFNEFKNR